MERVVALGRRILPRGWAHFGVQVGLWFGFYISYLAVRSDIDQNPAVAVANGLKVIHLERRYTHHLFELTVQRIVDSSQFLLTAAAWTYWNSEFTVIGLTLLWVYLRRHEQFARFRNAILLANLIGLIGYVVMPTAPPWMFTQAGLRRRRQPLERTHPHVREPVRGDAEPPRGRRAHRRLLPRSELPQHCGRRCSGRCGRCGCGSASSRRRTTTSSTCSPGSRSPSFSLLVTSGMPKLFADSRPCYRKPAIVAS